MTDLDNTIADWREHGTPGPWSGYNMVGIDSKPMTAEEIGEYVTNSVKMADSDRFLFVSGKHEDGGPADVCHTGNGPKGPYNTALISAAPAMADEIDRLRKQLKDTLDREAETHRRHDAKLDAKDACIAELESLLTKFADAIENSKSGDPSDPNAVILDGASYSGPVVDWAFKVLSEISQQSRATLKRRTER